MRKRWSEVAVKEGTGGDREKKKTERRGRNKLDSCPPLRNVLQEDIGNILVEMQ